MVMQREFTKPISKSGAVFLIIAGILLGTVFTVGMHFWNGRVTRENAISVSAAFSSCTATYRNGHMQEIVVRFADDKQLTIDGVCLSDEVVSKVESLQSGTILNLYIHPNSDTILEMVDGGEVILAFDEAVDQLSAEASGFMVLGIFMYICAAAGVMKLVRKK